MLLYLKKKNMSQLTKQIKQLSITRERIRQIEAKALRKLKHPSCSRKLRSFLDCKGKAA